MEKKKDSRQKETLIKVLKYIKPYGGLMTIMIIMAVISVAFTLYLPVLTGKAVDLLKQAGEAGFWDDLFHLLKKMAVVILLTSLAQWIMSICNNKIVYNIIQDIRKKAFRRLEILPLNYVDDH